MQKPTSSFVSVKTRVLLIDFELPMFFRILKNKECLYFPLKKPNQFWYGPGFFALVQKFHLLSMSVRISQSFFMNFSPDGTKCGRLEKIDYFKTLKISTFSRKLWKKWNITWKLYSFLVWYLCSIEIKEVGKCENFPNEKKNVANPSHDLKWTFDNLTWRGYIEAKKKHIWPGTGVTFYKKVL